MKTIMPISSSPWMAVTLVAALFLAPACAFGDIPAPPDVAAAPADAETTSSGLASKVLTKGTGSEYPGASDLVTVHYTGWTTDGKLFDSSLQRGEPATFPLDRVIDGWTEGVQLMVVGEKRRLWIPEQLAYQGREGRPQGMLVFDVELVSFERIFTPPPAPPDVAEPPEDATVERTGLAWKVLRPGTGDQTPKSRSMVKVHYTGWTTDGQMFDSSYARGEPSEFRLDNVIKGWTVGVGKMVVGEKRRLWVPEKLAYRGHPERPQGMLVFDIELIEIVRR